MEPKSPATATGLAATFHALASGNQTEEALRARREKILSDIRSTGSPPSYAQMEELVRIGIALGDG